jgi:hypothetical protein
MAEDTGERSVEEMLEVTKDGCRLRQSEVLPPVKNSITEEEKLIIATVPHTGTMALKQALYPYYPDFQDFPHKIDGPNFEEVDGRQLVCTHFRWSTKHIIVLPWKKITPIRDPMLTVISQAARKSFKSKRITPQRMIEAWELFALFYNRRMLEIIRLDDKERLGVEVPFITKTRNYEAHEAYKNGDFEFVKECLRDDTWDQIVALQPMLQPIFDKEGYGPYPWYK